MTIFSMSVDVDIFTQSFDDLHEDFEELLWLINDRIERLMVLRSRRRDSVLEETSAMLLKQEEMLLETYRNLAEELSLMMNDEKRDDLRGMIRTKQRIGDEVRSLQGVCASLCVAMNWQSPSFLHSVQSQAGLETGKIVGTIDDYKRDQHKDGLVYEQRFAKEYIDASFRFPPQVFATASGMAAMTTVIACLLDDKTCIGPVLLGRSSYFENICLVQLYFAGRFILVDEMDTEGILEAIRIHQPSAIFLDSLCNAVTVAMPDLATLLPRIAKEVTVPTTLVLDATGTAMTYQPLSDIPRWNTSLRIVVVESLLKYHQFGMDRVSGGVVWRTGLSPLFLFSKRMRLGTNLVDASVLSLPLPNRKMLEKRMMRQGRNAMMMAEGLEKAVKKGKRTAISRVVYPGLLSHPAYEWMKSRAFCGSFFVVVFKEKYRKVGVYQRFLKLVIEEARKLGIDLVAGSSFGFSSTRVYLTALHSTGTTEPFVRVSVGTETVWGVEKLVVALERAGERLG